MLAEYTTRNQSALVELIEKHNVDVRPFPDDVLQKLQTLSDEVVAEVAAADPMSEKVYKSYKAYRDNVKAYHAVSEQAYINARD
jgi:TRAP-type mannitol/chloroaromatic compound transport system substrate-binding protein